jgi:hypothetical protein
MTESVRGLPVHPTENPIVMEEDYPSGWLQYHYQEYTV